MLAEHRAAPDLSWRFSLLRSWAADTPAAVAWVTVERGERDAHGSGFS
jgi:hypothetical protein